MRLFNINVIMPFFLLFPMISRWILPSSIETSLVINFHFYSLYVPDLSFLVYIFLYHRNGFAIKAGSQLHTFLKLMSFLLIGYAFILGIAKDNSEIILPITSCLAWLYITIIFVFFPLPDEQIEQSKYIVLPALFFLIAEILLYSLGILQYTSSMGTGIIGEQYSGIARISTTIGAATGTALIVMILGVIATSCYRIPLWSKLLVYLLTSISILFTISRGSIMVWLIYLIVAISFNCFSRLSFFKKLMIPFIVISALICFNYFGFFNPVLQRSEKLSYSKQIESGRDALRRISLNIASESNYLGVGLGAVFPDKDVAGSIHSAYKTAPHNSYIVVLSELGFVGLCLFVVLMIMLLFSLDYKKPVFWMFLSMMLINFNTEGVLLHSEFWGAVMLFYLTMRKRDEISLHMYA